MPDSQQLLFTPGPVPIADATKAAMNDILYHKSEDFQRIHEELVESLQCIMQTNGPILIAPGSGTTGAEISMRGLTPNRSKILVLVQGRFSQRWAELGELFGHDITLLKSEWGKFPTCEELEEILKKITFHSIWITHTETSTAVTVPLQEYCSLIRLHSPDSLIIVDGVSSIGLEQCNMIEFGIDCLFTASQKGLSAPPGACIIALSERAKSYALSNNFKAQLQPSMVHDLEHMIMHAETHEAMFTPPVQCILALRASCSTLASNPNHTTAIRIQSEFIRTMLSTMSGCTVSGNALGVTAVFHENPKLIIQQMKYHGIIIAPGQDNWKSIALRIGHMVLYSEKELQQLQQAFSTICGLI